MGYWELADNYIRGLNDTRIRGIVTEKELKILHSDRAKRIHFIIKKFLNKKNPKVLDVGCGLGEIDIGLSRFGYKITAFDSDRGAIKIAKIGNKESGTDVNFYVDDDIKLKKRFDLVIMNHSIEHLADAEKILKKVFKVLNSSGVLFLTTANRLYFIDPHTGALFSPWFDKKLFTWNGLKGLLEDAGFTVHNLTPYVLQNIERIYSSSEHHSPLKFKLMKVASKLLRSERLINIVAESFFIVATVSK